MAIGTMSINAGGIASNHLFTGGTSARARIANAPEASAIHAGIAVAAA
jgi:hypothetical protein